MWRAQLALAVAGVCLAQHGVGQETRSKVTIEVGDCVAVKSPDERLACYDRLAEAAQAKRDPAAPIAESTALATTSAPAAAAAGAALSVPPASSGATRPAQSPGTVSAERASENAVRPDAEAKPPEIVATVTELRETVPNAWLITLDNGQVWRQNIPQRFALKAGERVTLRGTKWGAAYRLSAETLSGFIQVERVR
jgi:hypothetical protein